MSDEEREINDDEEQEEAPKEPIFNAYELAEVNGLVAPEGQGSVFANRSVDLEFKAYEANPEAAMASLDDRLDQVDEAISQAQSEEEINNLEAVRNTILQAQEIFPRLHEQRQMEAEFKQKLYDAEFTKAKKSGDWSKVLRLKNVLPADDLPDIYAEESLREVKKKIIDQAIESGDYSLAGRLNRYQKMPTAEPSLQELEVADDAADAHKQELLKLMEKCREPGDFTRLWRRVGLPH